MRTENEPAQRDQVELPKRPPAASVSRRSRPAGHPAPVREDEPNHPTADTATEALTDVTAVGGF